MLWFIYWDGHYVGTVIAADEQDALEKAATKFEARNWWVAHVEARPRGQKRSRGRAEYAAVS